MSLEPEYRENISQVVPQPPPLSPASISELNDDAYNLLQRAPTESLYDLHGAVTPSEEEESKDKEQIEYVTPDQPVKTVTSLHRPVATRRPKAKKAKNGNEEENTVETTKEITIT
jgi:hypothetical protein